MNLLRAFQSSLLLPKKDAMFRLNRMGMGGTIGYLFMLLFIVAIPSGVHFALSDHPGFENRIPPTLFVLQFFVFDYLLFVVGGLIVISVLAAVCLLLSKTVMRKLSYRQLWKISAYATTIPFLLYTLAQSLNWNSPLIPLLLFFLALVILVRMIFIFPRRKR
ncbi:MAG TPA: DUF1189 family protein [Bacillales bacterium]|nr:DUF1189 family protein [Bacillales bacterium]